MGDIKLYIKIVIIAVFAIISSKNAMAAILEVGPSGYEFISIQAAIESSSYGDEVLVYDGIYKENIDFQGKRIIVRSVHGAYRTIIDGASSENVVKFRSGEGTNSRLDGFSIRNGSDLKGSGIYCNSSSPTIANCIISDNCLQTPYGNSSGGGIYCSYNSSPMIINCIINNNTASYGGGIYCWYYSSPMIINCTISNNNASWHGGGICCTYHSSPIIVNSIFWGNIAGESSGEIYLDSDSSINVTYSDIQNASGIYPGAGNINADPLFVQIGNTDYYLGKDSPCIDKGNPTNAPSEDQGRIPRPQGPGIDMGAYEYVDPLYCTPKALFTANLKTGVAPLEVEFDASSSGGSQYTGALFSWDFGDGSTGMGMTASHIYSTFGSYDVSFTITTECGDHTIILYDLIKVRSTYVTKEVGEGHVYASIQEAITDAEYGEIILVHDGIYRESINFNGKAITLRSENGAANTFIDGNTNGTVVTFNHGEGTDSILEGFTIQNGSGYKGGGISCTNGSSPAIANCSILNNNASFGSGVSCDSSSPEFNNCYIYSNVASIEGGGIYCAHESMPVITNCIFYDNNAYNKGGGICCEADSSLIITKCTIANNKAGSDGGGIYCYYSSPSITNSVISSNNAHKGGGIYFYHCSPAVTNCTISNNTASDYGGGICCQYYAQPVIINSILWGNKAAVSHDELFVNDTISISVAYSNIQQASGVYPGTGNINSDPLFVEMEQGNLYLSAVSPCIDAGSSTYAHSDDREGIARPQGSGIDMGAYEYVDHASCIPRASFTANQTKGTDSLTVDFDASSSGGSQYTGATFFWDFGDGLKGEGMTPSHTYSQSGSYNVSLTIDTGFGIHTLALYDLIKIKSSHVTKEVGEGHAYTSIQDAITDADYGEIILVHDGIYFERINFSGKEITVRSENGASATIIDADGLGNVAVFNHSEDAGSLLDGFTIQNGSASTGGGIYCDRASPTIANCTIHSNTAFEYVGEYGGGILCFHSSSLITNCTIRGNTGSGISCIHSSPTTIDCTISGNTRSGIYCESSSPIITNCVITANSADDGGGILCKSSAPVITNCTIANNSALNIGGGIFCNDDSSPIITNCILWDDLPQEIFTENPGAPVVVYSDIQGGYGDLNMTHNIDKAPIFIDQNAGDYHLRLGSPCIDAGTNENAPSGDLDLLSRPQDGDGDGEAVCDMGAYEFAGAEIHIFCGGSIQTAVNAANDNDLIIVHPGTYAESIDFLGKAITIKSTDPNDPDSVAATIISGGADGGVVIFDDSEGADSVLEGFTLNNIHIYCHYSSPAIINCTIRDNKCRGISCYNSSPLISNCTITGNIPGYDGGGIYCFYSSPIITNCTISNNIAIYNGGGIYCHHSSPEIISCSINGNTTESDGGGIYCAYSTPIIINCAITGNIAEEKGGGVYCSGSSSPDIINCTISSNTAVEDGGGIYCNDDSSSPIITNCILWNDSPQEISVDGENFPVITYSDIYQKTDVYPGIGNINAHPSFVGSDVGNYYLMAGSPCIDTGTSTNAPSEDKEGIARPQGAGTDMGAYEYVESTSCTPRASFTVDQTKGIDPLTVEFDASSSGGSQYSGAIFSWDFGDGTSGSGLTASHTYTGYGYYDVSLTIGTGCGSHRMTLDDLIKIRSAQMVIKEVGEGHAYTSIQAAIDDADYGETVLVHDGTYIENINFKGKEITVRSEHGAASTIITANGGINGRLVTFDHREGMDSVLDGFTIQNASLMGISCHSSSPAITNCVIKDNTDNGVYCTYSSPQITNCTISGNRNNGIYCQDSSSIIINCRIHNNKNYGIFCSSSSSSTITSCIISRNTRSGIYCRYSSPGITNCIISGNVAHEGAGIYCYHASPIITNCTIIDNTAVSEGGGISCRNSSPSITNCIIWNNLPQEIYIGSPIVTYSNIKQDEGVYPGIGNINADPLFVVSDEGNYYLTADSPCIDAGTSTNAPSEDKEGIARPQSAGIDMGAYEYVESTSCIPRASFSANQTKGTGSLAVEFDASSSGGSQYSGATFSWDFGDGATGSEMTSSHTYTSNGFYDVSLTISTECGNHRLILYDLIKISSYQASKEVGEGYAYTSIQAAIDDADYGEIILVHDGTYIESINFKGKAIIVRSEHGASSTIIDGSETDTVVTFDHSEGPESQLDGFTIQNAPYNNGIYCLYASPVIANCTITANRAGGINCLASSPTITNCTIIDNRGKGIDCFHSSPEITNCIISGNRAGQSNGGGIDCSSSSPKITNCTISNNMAEEGGGGIYCSSSSPEITNCIISGNWTRSHGGGICCSNLSLPKITNCTISNNTSEEDGGGVYCTHDSSPTITNCIIWINSPQEISIFGENTLTITYSDIYQKTGLYPGVENINADPLFMKGEGGNYYLMADSPCIDAGTSTNAPSEDKEGIARPQGAGIDMGVYEYVEPASCTPRASFTVNQTEGTDSLTVEFDASSSGGSQYSGATFSWDFGDGATGSEITSSHTYTSNGSHDVSLTISTECGSHMLILNDLIKIKSSQVTKEVGEGYAYTSIQAAIDDADYGELILVHDGTYIEHINFMGKMITIRSENGASAAIIDGSGSEKVVTFNHSEGIDSVLDGFTIKNGFDRGIFIENSSPMIANCRIVENQLYGIYCHNSIARVLNCLLWGNSATEISSQIFLKDDSGTYKNIQIINQTNDSRACIQRYDQRTGRWQSCYRFFGKPSFINTPLLADEFLFISLLP